MPWHGSATWIASGRRPAYRCRPTRARSSFVGSSSRSTATRPELAFGTVDTWLLWNLTGGFDGGVHATDVTNASRTMLMDLATCEWDDAIVGELGIPRSVLPEIRGSSEVYGDGVDDLAGVPIAAMLGDQHAALFGQTCFEAGEAKCTYGTGAFMLMHTGITPVASTHGLITTVAARLGGPETPTTYALEGSVAVAGALVQWLRDDLGIIDSATEIEPLARSVPDSGDIVIVPAFSGLFAPHWRPDARGIIAGLTRYTTKAHIARAALEATAYQVADLAEAMAADLGAPLPGELRVDGGMTRNGLLMQIQADILGSAVVVPEMAETTALGAAYAAGLAVGFWEDLDELRSMSSATRRFEPRISKAERLGALARWHKGVERSLDWIEPWSVYTFDRTNTEQTLDNVPRLLLSAQTLDNPLVRVRKWRRIREVPESPRTVARHRRWRELAARGDRPDRPRRGHHRLVVRRYQRPVIAHLHRRRVRGARPRSDAVPMAEH